MLSKTSAFLVVLVGALFAEPTTVDRGTAATTADPEATAALILTADRLPYDPANARGCGSCHTDCFGDEHAVWEGYPLADQQTHQCWGPAYCVNHQLCNQAPDADQIVQLWERRTPATLTVLREIINRNEFAWVNVERSSIQVERCGSLSANLPLTPLELAVLTD